MKWAEWVTKQLATLRTKLGTAPEAERAAIQAEITELESVQGDGTPGGPPQPVSLEPAPAGVPPSTGAPQGDGNDLDARIEKAVAKAMEKVVPQITQGLDNRDKATQRKADITTALDQAVSKGKIPAAKRTEWEKRLTDSYDAVKPILDELPDNPAINKGQGGNGAAPTTTQPNADGAKKYDNAFARSIPSPVMKYVEESIQK